MDKERLDKLYGAVTLEYLNKIGIQCINLYTGGNLPPDIYIHYFDGNKIKYRSYDDACNFLNKIYIIKSRKDKVKKLIYEKIKN